MSKFKVLESTEVIIDQDSTINIKENLDKSFNVEIKSQNDKILICIPYADGSGTYFVSYKDAIKVLQDHYFCFCKE